MFLLQSLGVGAVLVLLLCSVGFWLRFLGDEKNTVKYIMVIDRLIC